MAFVAKAYIAREEMRAGGSALSGPLVTSAGVAVYFAMFFLIVILTFGEFLANFERLVHCCIDADFCK